MIYHRLFSQVSFQLHITMIWVHMHDGPFQKGRSIIHEFNNPIKLAAKNMGTETSEQETVKKLLFWIVLSASDPVVP